MDMKHLTTELSKFSIQEEIDTIIPPQITSFSEQEEYAKRIFEDKLTMALYCTARWVLSRQCPLKPKISLFSGIPGSINFLKTTVQFKEGDLTLLNSIYEEKISEDITFHDLVKTSLTLLSCSHIGSNWYRNKVAQLLVSMTQGPVGNRTVKWQFVRTEDNVSICPTDSISQSARSELTPEELASVDSINEVYAAMDTIKKEIKCKRTLQTKGSGALYNQLKEDITNMKIEANSPSLVIKRKAIKKLPQILHLLGLLFQSESAIRLKEYLLNKIQESVHAYPSLRAVQDYSYGQTLQ